MKILNKEYSKATIITMLKKFLVVVFGSFLVAFGTGVFLVPVNICAGGLSGIAIIFDKLVVSGYVDVTVTVLTWFLMILSLIFLGKKFTFNSLISSIFVPLFLVMVYRVPFFQDISKQLVSDFQKGDLVSYLLCALFGGGIIGLGVAASFAVGGSTGGVDIIAFLIKKLFPKIKMSYITFFIDAVVILTYTIIFWNSSDDFVSLSLMNILCAISTAVVVDMIYVNQSKNLICEVVSDKWQTINDYIQQELKRGSTIILGKGGYKGLQKNIIRVVISMDEYNSFYETLKKIDPYCFVTFTMTKSVIGNGFNFQEGDEPLFKTIVIKSRKKQEMKRKNAKDKQ